VHYQSDISGEKKRDNGLLQVNYLCKYFYLKLSLSSVCYYITKKIGLLITVIVKEI